MEQGDRVIVPSYRSWKDDGEPYMVTETEHLTGKIGKITPINTGPPYKEYDENGKYLGMVDPPAPGTDYHAWVVLDNPIGAQDVIQCRASRLIKLED